MKIFFLSILAMSGFCAQAFACTFNCFCDAQELKRGCYVYYSTECSGSPEHQTCMKYPNCTCSKPAPPDDNCSFNCYCTAKQLKRGCYNYKSTECTGDPGHQTCMDYPNCSCP